MNFGRRDVASRASGAAWRSHVKSNDAGRFSVIEASSPITASGRDLLRKTRGFWSQRIASDRLLYPLTCLAAGLFLGGAVGAAVAPQLLHAEDAGVYEVIRQSAAMQAAKAQRWEAAAVRPQLQQFHLRGRVMRARLAPTRHTVARETPSPEPAPAETHFATPIEAILNDPTLRAGDTVILESGAKVFRGGHDKHLPHVSEDFVDFRESTLLTKLERRQIDSALGLTQKTQALAAFETRIRTTPAALDPHTTPSARAAPAAPGSMVQVLR
jgi:hypothetical protein